MKKNLIISIILMSALLLFLNLPPLFPTTTLSENATQQYDKVILDTSLFYRSGHEQHIQTAFDFFKAEGLDEFPADINGWHLENISFHDDTYSFYSPDEISGKQVSNAGDRFFIILITSPKLLWHTPENCYLFSNWTLTNKTIERWSQESQDNRVAGAGLYFNKFTVAKDNTEYLVRYFYIFKDRSDIRNISQLMVIVPLYSNETPSDSSAMVFLNNLFLSYNPEEEGTVETKGLPANTEILYGENNPPVIKDWLVIGPWETAYPRNASFPAPDWEINWLNKDYSKMMPAAGQKNNGKVWQLSNGSYGIVRFDPLVHQNIPMYAYAGEYIHSNETKTVLLHVVSDDGIRVWLNGNLVHSRIRTGTGGQIINTVQMARGSSLEDTVPITLHAGWNNLLLELFQWKGSFEYYCTLRDLDGNPDPELQFSVSKPADSFGSEIKIFQIGYPNDSAAEFSSEWDVQNNFTVGEGFKEFPRAVSRFHRVTNINFNMPKEEIGQPHTLTLDVQKVDVSSTGYLIVNIYVNDRYVGSYRYPEDWLYKQIHFEKDAFMSGINTLQLEWMEGENYIVWDYIDLT